MESILQHKQPVDLNPNNLPAHVAVIMDGNGRWAKQRKKPRIFGHIRGVDSLKKLIRCCKDWGIPILTVYAFSTENWKRSTLEVNFLMHLIERILRRELSSIIMEDINISFIGDMEMLPDSLQAILQDAITQTKNNTAVKVVLAINYGGHQEILHACRQLAAKACRGELDPAQIDNSMLENHLYTAGIPAPDLLIRTSGEMRLSNFLLWQMAYTEMYVTDILWPDFDHIEFHQALLAYQQRNRRFGGLETTEDNQKVKTMVAKAL